MYTIYTVHTHTHTHTYIYIERERNRQTGRDREISKLNLSKWGHKEKNGTFMIKYILKRYFLSTKGGNSNLRVEIPMIKWSKLTLPIMGDSISVYLNLYL